MKNKRDFAPGRAPLYHLCRAALRAWFGLSFRRIRLLQAETLLRTRSALLVVNHPASFLDTLLLIAAFETEVHCVLERELMRGLVRRLWALTLGMIGDEFTDEGRSSEAVESACQILTRGGLVLVFARQRSAISSGDQAGFAPTAAAIAVEAASRLASVPLPVYPVHLFFPVAPSQSDELLIHVDAPLYPRRVPSSLPHETERSAATFDGEMERACRQNPFRLRQDTVEHFLAGVEGLMREDFAESWSRRPNSKQKVEDFNLSPFLVKLVNQLNYSHPGRLAALGEALDGYSESHRRWALARLRAETAGPWYRRWWRRAAVWLETVAGFPIAAYGLLNLLPTWFLLHIFGMLRRGLWRATTAEWGLRVIVAVACYAGQIALAAHFLPRSEAGYYAPSLPVSGAYLLRYLWLLDHRTRVVAVTLGKQTPPGRLRRLRKKLIAELRRDQDRYAAMWKIAH